MKTKNILFIAICIAFIASAGVAVGVAGEDKNACQVPTPNLSVDGLTPTYAHIPWSEIEIPTCCGGWGPEHEDRYARYNVWLNGDVAVHNREGSGFDFQDLQPNTEYVVDVQALPSSPYHDCNLSDIASVSFTTPMVETAEVTSIAIIPLWYWDENGIQRIPCTAPNPVQWGMPFGIAVSAGGEDDRTSIVTVHVDTGEQRLVPFTTTLYDFRTPPEYRRKTYTGCVKVDGANGTIQVAAWEEIPSFGRVFI